MNNEEQLKNKVKQQKTLMVCLFTMVVFLLLGQIISMRMSRDYGRELQQTKVRIEQLEKECQRLIELKMKDKQQDKAVNDDEEGILNYD